MANASTNLSLFPSPGSSRPPARLPDVAPSPQPMADGPARPRTQPVLRIRTAIDDDAAAGPAFRPIEFDPPRPDAVRPPPPPPPLRSMFPVYDPGVPLDRQQYGPAQTGPARVPRAVISRQSYHSEPPSEPPPASSLRRSAPAPAALRRPCSTSRLRGLWKAANGWKACGSEGRVYCLALSRLRDAPVYSLSSASAQPFYNLRLDPTSASAYVTLARHDPAKPYKPPRPDAASTPASNGSRASDTKGWHEALATTLEEEPRRHRPHDGLVARLMPSPAAAMALQRADDPAAAVTADNECARLVWDDDAASHFLVHPALARPFRVAVEHFPALSRTEYTLEHHESPRHLAKLTRDGAGGGCVEIDTSVASMIEAYYIVDVAVAALFLVAAADDRNTSPLDDTFEPPPPPPRAVLVNETKRSPSRLRMPRMPSRPWRKRSANVEQFDMDVESQDGSLTKAGAKRSKPKRSLLLRAVIKVAKGLFKSTVWLATILFRCLARVFKLLYRCVGSKY